MIGVKRSILYANKECILKLFCFDDNNVAIEV
jgi:hypothetical protein